MKDKLIGFVSIQLDKDLKEPLYVQLYEQIKLMINSIYYHQGINYQLCEV